MRLRLCCIRARTWSRRWAGFYPTEKEAAPLEVAAQSGNATLHGAGIGPGAATELFPLLLSVMSTGATFVRSEDFSDLRTYGAPDVLRYVMGFGGTPDSALTGPMQKLLDGGFMQSVRLCVDRLALPPTRRSAPRKRWRWQPRRSNRRSE